ncbi:MAG TPA: tRNA (N6-threonylcarbamoyladenosine(37)-N6)-methyltransferase TrmO [Deltaproteobacteria bacterium]|nr:tRNA (N6-threonylcarbamoyladenosine(37)-N6)-methyltransferase TrmO [Deltaproteobacteria bacterium]HOM29791.1 tRNA (N6-threonylcarbamoyladenosine(37)-N6)-methyltransferase TrmO [Deltaproteobacteria bacterium]HPP81327.1 tRNA (N6-threonylcarbamoyladenosine(37)-N6)-methyltransferase TrmO [Deltaproteobacteria bacterium]
MEISFKPIGVMHSPLKDAETAPRFYTESDVKGVIEVYPEYEAGLSNLSDYTHIVVVFYFHKSRGYELLQRRRGVGELRGVFSLCSPNRPNPIGISVLRLLLVEGNMLHVDNVDILDDTPILDIKPYKPFDYPQGG